MYLIKDTMQLTSDVTALVSESVKNCLLISDAELFGFAGWYNIERDLFKKSAEFREFIEEAVVSAIVGGVPQVTVLSVAATEIVTSPISQWLVEVEVNTPYGIMSVSIPVQGV